MRILKRCYITKLFYKITPIQTIENDSGVYEVWTEKVACLDYYMFFANQVSVKINGEHYYINNGLDRFSFHNNKLEVFDGNYSPCKPIHKYDIELNRLRGGYSGKITGYKKAFDYFKNDVYHHAKNKLT